MIASDRNHPEFKALLDLSVSAGSDPALVQAAGGNTSIKLGKTLWIKASGTWLMNALSDDIMVPVSLEPLLQALNSNDPAAERAQEFVIAEHNPKGLRPSIETTVHAALPQRVVVHVHCINTIAIAVHANAQQMLAPLLADFNWRYVPYVKPGLSLSRSIVESLSDSSCGGGSGAPDVIILGNHGLVVAAETVANAEQLLVRVSRALQQPARNAPAADLNALQHLAAESDYCLPSQVEAHGVASDEASLSIARGGSLYPDHVIFLGEGSVIALQGESPDDVTNRERANGKPPPVSIVFPGLGVLLRKDSGNGVEELARCLSDVCCRIPAGADLNYLSPAQNHELLNWDAEKYRQSLNH
ncbi:N-acylmannosamine 1-dehydrogenase [Chromatiales bacterium (ex Bugula neritina AB1)]|nr:N-acylmannosamine 1-dehydrogenase [Chromatiales bacterium (ex Bugula neritina AB1)]